MPAETALAAQFGVNRSTVREGIRSLEQNGLVRTQRALDNRESLTELDIKFHHLVAVAAHNPALLLSREPLSHLFYPAFYPVMDRLNARERLLSAHTRIVECIRKRDMQQAKTWMDKHIVDFRRGYELADLDIHAVLDRDLFAPRAVADNHPDVFGPISPT